MPGFKKKINTPLKGIDPDNFSKHKQDIYDTLDACIGPGLFGTAVLAAGTVTVVQPQCTTASNVILTPQGPGSTGTLNPVFSNGSFTINSSDASDTRKVAWWLWP